MLPLRTSVCALALFFVLAGCGQPAIPPSANYATVQGIVTDAATGQPVSGAVVTINEVLRSSPTGSDGAFVVRTVPSGTDDYVAQAPGYRAAGNSITVDPGATKQLNISLSKAQ